MNARDDFYTRLLQSSSERSLFKKLHTSKIYNTIAGKMKLEDLDRTLRETKKSAYFLPYAAVVVLPNSCHIYAPYVDHYPNFASMAMPKASPYYQLFQVLASLLLWAKDIQFLINF